MAVAAGLTVGLLLLLGLVLLRKGIRKPHWVLAILLLLSAAYFYGEDQFQRDTEHLRISTTGTTGCGDNQVNVTLTNAGPRDIQSFQFQLEGFLPNHSDSVVWESLRSDRIVPHGEKWTTCWDLMDLERIEPTEHSNLRWEVELTGVTLAE